jgi:hypothetical protein
MLDMGARNFQPFVGGFFQQDYLLGAAADLGLSADPVNSNRYALAGGNPVTYSEVDGHYASTSGPQSKDIQVQGGDVLDRQAGGITSSTSGARGPGDSGSTATEQQRIGSRVQSRIGTVDIRDNLVAPGTRVVQIVRSKPCNGPICDVLGQASCEASAGVFRAGNPDSTAGRIGRILAMVNPKGAIQHLAREGGEAAVKRRAKQADETSNAPNPWGRRGSPAHRGRIREVESRFTDRGWNVVAGG